MKTCEKCGSTILKVGKYSSGRFCSRVCANSRSWTPEINEKRSNTYRKTVGLHLKSNVCRICNANYTILRRRKFFLIGVCSSECNVKFNKNILVDRILNGEVSNPKVLKTYLEDNFGYNCVLCDNKGTHNGLPLILQLDHIDGNSDNNLPDNLRLLCPNCHTQTPTHSNKSSRNVSKNAHRTEVQKKWRRNKVSPKQ